MKREPTSTDVKHVTDLIYQFKPESEAETVARVWRAYEGFEIDSPPEDLASPAALDDIGARLERAARAYHECAKRAREAFGAEAGIPDAPYATLRYLDPQMPSAPAEVIAMTAARNARVAQRTPPPPPVRVRCKAMGGDRQCVRDEGHEGFVGHDFGDGTVTGARSRCPAAAHLSNGEAIPSQCVRDVGHEGPHDYEIEPAYELRPPADEPSLADDVKAVARRGLGELLKRLA